MCLLKFNENGKYYKLAKEFVPELASNEDLFRKFVREFFAVGIKLSINSGKERDEFLYSFIQRTSEENLKALIPIKSPLIALFEEGNQRVFTSVLAIAAICLDDYMNQHYIEGFKWTT